MNDENSERELKMEAVSNESLAVFGSRRKEIVVEATRRALPFENDVAHHGRDAENFISR